MAPHSTLDFIMQLHNKTHFSSILHYLTLGPMQHYATTHHTGSRWVQCNITLRHITPSHVGSNATLRYDTSHRVTLRLCHHSLSHIVTVLHDTTSSTSSRLSDITPLTTLLQCYMILPQARQAVLVV